MEGFMNQANHVKQPLGVPYGSSLANAEMTTGKPKAPPVWEALDRLQSAVGMAEKELDELSGRLHGALQPQPKCGTQIESTSDASCVLEGRVLDCTERLERLAVAIRELRQGLCI